LASASAVLPEAAAAANTDAKADADDRKFRNRSPSL
jgi:hypothetical protein